MLTLVLVESLRHAGFQYNCEVDIKWIYAEDIEKEGPDQLLAGVDAILVPGGFGERGIEGKIATAGYARQKQIPFLGICLGMQCAVIEFARNVCGLTGPTVPNSISNTPYPVVHLMSEQENIANKGGTMRLGVYPCDNRVRTPRFSEAYGQEDIKERHRHRYEINNLYRQELEKNGMKICGLSPDQKSGGNH